MVDKKKMEEIKDELRRLVGKNTLVEVGRRDSQAEAMGVSQAAMHRAVTELVEEGYKCFYIPFIKEGRQIHKKVLAVAGTTFGSIIRDKKHIYTIEEAREKLENEKGLLKMKINAYQGHRRTPKETEAMVFNMRQQKRKGMSNVAIAKEWGLNESTVRRHLKKPHTAKERLIDDMLWAINGGQSHIVQNIVNMQSFLDVFGQDYGPGYYLRQDQLEARAAYVVDVTDSNPAEQSFHIRLDFMVTKVADNR